MSTDTVGASVADADIPAEPVQQDELHAMIAAITPENQHREIDSGLSVGHETL